MTPIETALKQIGHLNKMRRDGSWLLGPCPRCGKNETLETFAIHEIAGSPHWLCGRCNRSGKTIASLEAFIADQPKPPAPKTNGNGKTNGHHAKPEEQLAKPIEVKADAKPDPTTAEIIYFKEKIERLGKMLKGIERAMKRTKIAREVGVSRKDIDDEIEQQATEREVETLFEHWKTEPWPNEVETDALVRDLLWRINRHVVCRYEDALTVALWIMFAWAHGAATHSPLLLVTSSEAESGKTTLLGIVGLLTPRAISTVEISEAALYRAIEKYRPAFVIDEFDTALSVAGIDANKTALRGVINGGHTRGQGVIRINKDTHMPEVFSTFAPKALGMIGRKMPPATLGRAIVVELKRRKGSERAEPFGHEDDKELGDLRSRLMRWSADNLEAVRSAKNTVTMPAGFNNRRADNWRVLFTIADSAGEEIAEHARHAAVTIEGSVDTGSVRIKLLADIKTIFDAEQLDRISSGDLAVRLAGLEAQARKRARTHRNLRSALAPSYLSRSTRRNKASMTMIGPKMAFILRVGSFREFAPAHEAGVYHLPVVFDVLGVPSLAHLIHHSRRGPQNPPTRQHKQLATRREAISLPSAEGRQGRTLGRGHKGREERRLVRASRR